MLERLRSCERLAQLGEPSFRRTALLRLGCAFNFVYAAFNMPAGILFASPWQGALALYYVVLGMMRLILIQNQREAARFSDAASRMSCEYYGCLRWRC